MDSVTWESSCPFSPGKQGVVGEGDRNLRCSSGSAIASLPHTYVDAFVQNPFVRINFGQKIVHKNNSHICEFKNAFKYVIQTNPIQSKVQIINVFLFQFLDRESCADNRHLVFFFFFLKRIYVKRKFPGTLRGKNLQKAL